MSDSDSYQLSELSDLTNSSDDSDADSYVATAAARKRKAPKKGDYLVTNALKPPRTAQYTAKSLYDQIVDGSIDLDPDYQRDVVWTETKQSNLIDSILRNYYIPPVIFAVTQADDGSTTRVCIDGKQRLTSIQRFMDGIIPHRDPSKSSTTKRWYKQAGKTKRTLLPQAYLKLFAHKQIVCVEYDNLTNDQEREIFQRVQQGMALTPAERMQAITGPWCTFIRELLAQIREPAPKGFAGTGIWDVDRGRDFQCVAGVVCMADKWPQTTHPDAGRIERMLSLGTPVKKSFADEIRDTFTIFAQIASDRRFKATFKSKVAPVELTMISMLIWVHRASFSFVQMHSAIEKMRKDVRAKYAKTVRSNSTVVKHLCDFINKLKVSSLESDGQGDLPAARAVKNLKKTAQKRKLDDMESSLSEDEDEEERPAKVATKAKTTTPRKTVNSASTSAGTSTKGSSTKAASRPDSPTSARKTAASSISTPASKLRTATRTGGAPASQPLTAAKSVSMSASAASEVAPMPRMDPVPIPPPPTVAPAPAQHPALPRPSAPVQPLERVKLEGDLPSPSLTPSAGNSPDPQGTSSVGSSRPMNMTPRGNPLGMPPPNGARPPIAPNDSIQSPTVDPRRASFGGSFPSLPMSSIPPMQTLSHMGSPGIPPHLGQIIQALTNQGQNRPLDSESFSSGSPIARPPSGPRSFNLPSRPASQSPSVPGQQFTPTGMPQGSAQTQNSMGSPQIPGFNTNPRYPLPPSHDSTLAGPPLMNNGYNREPPNTSHHPQQASNMNGSFRRNSFSPSMPTPVSPRRGRDEWRDSYNSGRGRSQERERSRERRYGRDHAGRYKSRSPEQDRGPDRRRSGGSGYVASGTRQNNRGGRGGWDGPPRDSRSWTRR